MALPGGVFNEDYQHDTAIVRTTTQWALLLGFLILFFSLPLIAGSYWTFMLNYIGITIIAALGLQLLLGYCGQISIGHAAFMSVGAFASAIIVTQLNFPFLVALPLAGLVAGVVGLIFGLPALRVKGLYLALTTMAAQFIISWLILHDVFKPLFTTGGSIGLTVPPASIAGFMFNTDFRMFYLVFPIVILMIYFAKRISMTKVGRAWVAIRDNELAAQAMGINVFYYKLLAFFVGCFFAGIGGSLWVHYSMSAILDSYTFLESIWFIGIIIVGGLGSITGTIFGAVFVRLLWEYAYRFANILTNAIPNLPLTLAGSLPTLLLGIIFILVLVFEPRGLYHRWELFKMSYRVWPYSY